MSKAGRSISGAASGAATGAAMGSIVPGIGTAIGGVVGGIGGLLGGLLGGGDEDEEAAKALQAEALDQIRNLSLPDIEKLKLQLEQLQAQGQITPEMQETILQQTSGMENVSTDPRLKDAQMSALTKMQSIGQDGLSAQDRLRVNDVRRNTAQDQQAADAAIMQSMNARGAGGSGVELAQRLISGQGQANRASQQGDSIAAMANQQALEAIMKSGQLGGDMRTQDFSEQSRKAEAQDAINRFNAANRQGVSNANVGLRNRAQELNLGEAQRIADANTATRNGQQQYNKNLAVEDYNRRLRKAEVTAGALNTAAGQKQASADKSNAEFANTMSGLQSAATGIVGGIKAPTASAARVAEDPYMASVRKKASNERGGMDS